MNPIYSNNSTLMREVMMNPIPNANIQGDTPDKGVDVLNILMEMRKQGLENDFINSLMMNCPKYEGVHDLMNMWYDEADSNERDNIIADLQESIDDIESAPHSPEERPYLNFDDLKDIKSDILEFKKTLKKEVDHQGGISKLARLTGIPQPSLSRFFTSSSMPRRTTLYKIAKALQLSESVISTKWIR